jgi:hypothetical protein
MKTSITIPVILKTIDQELKSLLLSDLERFKVAQTSKQIPLKKAA